MARGKKTGGRKKGSKNKRTVELEKATGGILPLDYMLRVLRDEQADPLRRDEMAKAAAPYIHARRAPEDRKGNTIPPMIYYTPNLEAEDEERQFG
jgi:hypothetical protein